MADTLIHNAVKPVIFNDINLNEPIIYTRGMKMACQVRNPSELKAYTHDTQIVSLISDYKSVTKIRFINTSHDTNNILFSVSLGTFELTKGFYIRLKLRNLAAAQIGFAYPQYMEKAYEKLEAGTGRGVGDFFGSISYEPVTSSLWRCGHNGRERIPIHLPSGVDTQLNLFIRRYESLGIPIFNVTKDHDLPQEHDGYLMDHKSEDNIDTRKLEFVLSLSNFQCLEFDTDPIKEFTDNGYDRLDVRQMALNSGNKSQDLDPVHAFSAILRNDLNHLNVVLKHNLELITTEKVELLLNTACAVQDFEAIEKLCTCPNQWIPKNISLLLTSIITHGKENFFQKIHSKFYKDYSLNDNEKGQLLCAAARYGREDLLKRYITEHTKDFICNSQKETPILIVAKNGYLPIVKCLMDKGCNITRIREKNKKAGENAIQLAVRNNHPDVALALLQKSDMIKLEIESWKEVLKDDDASRIAKYVVRRSSLDYWELIGIDRNQLPKDYTPLVRAILITDMIWQKNKSGRKINGLKTREVVNISKEVKELAQSKHQEEKFREIVNKVLPADKEYGEVFFGMEEEEEVSNWFVGLQTMLDFIITPRLFNYKQISMVWNTKGIQVHLPNTNNTKDKQTKENSEAKLPTTVKQNVPDTFETENFELTVRSTKNSDKEYSIVPNIVLKSPNTKNPKLRLSALCECKEKHATQPDYTQNENGDAEFIFQFEHAGIHTVSVQVDGNIVIRKKIPVAF